MAPKDALSERPYAIQVADHGRRLLPYTWSIVDTRTREPVEDSREGYRSREAAFAAAGPALHRWLYERA